MSPVFTVVEAQQGASKPDRGFGPMMEILLTLQNGQESPVRAVWYTKAGTPVPDVGSSISGDVTDSEYGMKFKKANAFGGGGGGPRPEDPKRAARIMRMHSQDMALRTIDLLFRADMADVKDLDKDQFRAAVQKWADWFDNDANQAAK